MSAEKTLTQEELTQLLVKVKTLYERQLDRYLNEETRQKIQIFLLTYGTNPSFYQYALERPIMETIEAFSSDRDLCDYVLSCTSALAQWLACADLGLERVVKTVARAIEYGQSNYGEMTLLPHVVASSVEVKKDPSDPLWLEEFLMQNLWLVGLYLNSLANTLI